MQVSMVFREALLQSTIMIIRSEAEKVKQFNFIRVTRTKHIRAELIDIFTRKTPDRRMASLTLPAIGVASRIYMYRKEKNN